MKKVLVVVLALVLAVTAFAGCSQAPAESADTAASDTVESASAAASDAVESASAAAGKDPSEMSFGYLVQTQTTEFMLSIAEGIQTRCDELGITLTVNDADGDPSTQISQCESMIAQQMDAIIVTPVDAQACVPIIEKCNAAGIPVIGVCTTFEGDLQPDAFVGSDDNQSAELAVTALADAIGGKGKIGMIRGIAGQSSEVIRGDAAKKLLEEKYPDIEIIAEDIGNWSRDEGMTIMENWINTYGDEMVGVFAQNDEMAIGACNALENAGMTGKIQVTGIDLVADAEEYLADGRLAADVFQDGYGQGYASVDVALALINGEDFQKETWIPFELVTKDNMDEYFE